MRALFLVLALTLSACARPAATNCDLTVTRELSFSGQTPETITVRSFGATCEQAIGLFTINAADGHPVWAWAIPLATAFGEGFVEPDVEAMRAFLQRWSEAETTTTSQAPEWTLLAPGQTTLDRLTYDDIRARNLPMLCHYSGTGRQVCVFFEPAAGGAGHYLDRDTEQQDPS